MQGTDAISSCTVCAPGTVKVPDGYNVVNAQCIPASVACGSAQTAVSGRCSSCTWGQVQGTDALSSCTVCAPGTVKVPDGYNVVNATCQPALTACGSAQTAVNGRCSACSWGQVKSGDGNTCVACPGVTVKVPDGYDLVSATCVHASYACGSAQTGVNGRCAFCTYGQTRDCATGACAVCDAGLVKVPDSYNTVNASCVPATIACGSAQAALNGRCSFCSWGAVQSSDGASCQVCPAGYVKVPDGYNVVNATCQPALTACGSAQTAVNGRCSNCGWGQVKSGDGTSCITCPSPTVKVPDAYDVANATCVHAQSACGTAQAAVNGRCSACSWGAVRGCNGGECTVCGPTTVKVPDGYNVVDAQCLPASIACGSAQTALNGRCSSCSWGQVQSSDGNSSCVACPAGTVKTPDGYNLVNATCQPASVACGSAQTAVSGRCSSCSWGQVQGTDALSSCTVCGSGLVKFPDGYNLVNATCEPAVDKCGTAQRALNGRCASCSWGQVRNSEGTGCSTCGSGTVKYPDGYDVVNATCQPAATACAPGQTAVNGRCSVLDGPSGRGQTA